MLAICECKKRIYAYKCKEILWAQVCLPSHDFASLAAVCLLQIEPEFQLITLMTIMKILYRKFQQACIFLCMKYGDIITNSGHHPNQSYREFQTS